MHRLILLSFVLLAGLLACESKTETTEVAEEPSGPMEWLTFKGKEDGKNIVFISGDEEYRSEEALPQLAAILSERHGFNCTVLFAQDPDYPGIVDPNYLHNIPGLEALADADLAYIFTRFRALPDDQMSHIEDYLTSGKPVVGIRTATHAFLFKDSTSSYRHWGNSNNDPESEWDGGFGRLVLGEKWISHHGHHKQQSTLGLLAEGTEGHPITNGISNGDIWGPTDVYGVRLPLPGDSKPIIMGQVMNRTDEFDESDPFFGLKPTDSEISETNPASNREYNPNDPMMPVAWTKSYQLPGGTEGMAFASTIGSSTDMANEGVRRLFVNATYHLLGLEVPESANVDVVGSYDPSAYSFQTDEYWTEKNIVISDLVKK